MNKYIPEEGELVAVSFDGDTWYPAVFSEYTEEYRYDVYIATLDGNTENFLFPMCEPIHNRFNVPDKKNSSRIQYKEILV